MWIIKGFDVHIKFKILFNKKAEHHYQIKKLEFEKYDKISQINKNIFLNIDSIRI
ncbi:hypothetical protein YTPLAS73_00700 [Nitrosarchaeum sp.]|nr:hypothetical protein YTPLAS73_00700 [Nitrosarchaeum sp.]